MKKPPLKSFNKYTRLLAAFVVAFTAVSQILLTGPAFSAQITLRKLTLEDGTQTTMGGSTPGSVVNSSVNHNFSMTIPNAGSVNVGSIKMEYCTTAALTCTIPTGLLTNNSAGASNPGTTLLGAQAGMGAAFTLNTTTPGVPYLTRTPSTLTAASTASWRLDNVTNPTASNETFFVRISTYASNNITGSPIDTGVVAASTAEPIVLDGIMPESLVFCTGATISMTLGVPDCSTATAGTITFSPQLFSPITTSTATSQMAASTNASFGYAITANGATLTSGANTITAIPSPGAITTQGTSQFGMNLRLNTAPAIGADIDDPSDNALLRGIPQPDYNTPDTFTYVDGAIVAKSDHVSGTQSGTPVATNAQIYTASYIVNVPGSQAAGTYVATISYVCTPTF